MYMAKMMTPTGCHSSPLSCHSPALSIGLEISALLYWSLEAIWQYFCAVGRRGYNNTPCMLSPNTNDAWCQLGWHCVFCFFKRAAQKKKLIWTQMSNTSNLLWCPSEAMFKEEYKMKKYKMRGSKWSSVYASQVERWCLMLNMRVCFCVRGPDN